MAAAGVESGKWGNNALGIDYLLLIDNLSTFFDDADGERAKANSENYMSSYLIDSFTTLLNTKYKGMGGKNSLTTDQTEKIIKKIKDGMKMTIEGLKRMEETAQYTAFCSNFMGKMDGGQARDLLELQDTDPQCNNTVGSRIKYPKLGCWICGHAFGAGQKNPQCEHILPVTGALFHLNLYQIATSILNYDVYDQALIGLEYQWAHACCNMAKKERLFIKANPAIGKYVIAVGKDEGINQTFEQMHKWRGHGPPISAASLKEFSATYGNDMRAFEKEKASHDCAVLFPLNEAGKGLFQKHKLSHIVQVIKPIVDIINEHIDFIKEKKKLPNADALLVYQYVTYIRFMGRIAGDEMVQAFKQHFLNAGLDKKATAKLLTSELDTKETAKLVTVVIDKVKKSTKYASDKKITPQILLEIEKANKKLAIIKSKTGEADSKKGEVKKIKASIVGGYQKGGALCDHIYQVGHSKNGTHCGRHAGHNKYCISHQKFHDDADQKDVGSSGKQPAAQGKRNEHILQKLTKEFFRQQPLQVGNPAYKRRIEITAEARDEREKLRNAIRDSNSKANISNRNNTAAREKDVSHSSVMAEIASLESIDPTYRNAAEEATENNIEEEERIDQVKTGNGANSERSITDDAMKGLSGIDMKTDIEAGQFFEDHWSNNVEPLLREDIIYNNQIERDRHSGGENHEYLPGYPNVRLDPYAAIQNDFNAELSFMHLLAYHPVYLQKMNKASMTADEYMGTTGILAEALHHAGYKAHEIKERFGYLLKTPKSLKRSTRKHHSLTLYNRSPRRMSQKSKSLPTSSSKRASSLRSLTKALSERTSGTLSPYNNESSQLVYDVARPVFHKKSLSAPTRKRRNAVSSRRVTVRSTRPE